MSADESPRNMLFDHAHGADLFDQTDVAKDLPLQKTGGKTLDDDLLHPVQYKFASGAEAPTVTCDLLDVDSPRGCALSSDDDSPVDSHVPTDHDAAHDSPAPSSALEGETAGSAVGAVALGEVSPGSPGPVGGEWACSDCTLLNTEERASCSLCGTRRAGAALPVPTPPVLASDGEWVCETCTFINPNVTSRCCMCHTRRCDLAELDSEGQLDGSGSAEPLPRPLDDVQCDALPCESSSASASQEMASTNSHRRSPQKGTILCEGTSLESPPRGSSLTHDQSTPSRWLQAVDAARRDPDSSVALLSAPFASLMEATHRRIPSSSSGPSIYPPAAPPAHPKSAPEAGSKGKTFSSRLGLEKLLKRPKAKAEDASLTVGQAAASNSAVPSSHADAEPHDPSRPKAAAPHDPSPKGFRSLGSLFSAKFTKFGQQSPPSSATPVKTGAQSAATSPSSDASPSHTLVVPPAPLFTIRSDPSGGFVFNPLHRAQASSSSSSAANAADAPRLPASAPQWPSILLSSQQGYLSSSGWGHFYHRSRRHEEDARGHSPDVVEIIPDTTGSISVQHSPWAAHRPQEVRHSRKGPSTTYLIGTIDSNAFRQTFGEAVHKYIRHSHRHWRSSPTTLDHPAAMWAALTSGTEGDLPWRRILRPHHSLAGGEDLEWRDRLYRSAREREEELSLATRARELSRHQLERGRERDRDGQEGDHEKERSLLRFMEDGGWGSGARASKLGRFLFFGGKDEDHHSDGDKKAASKRSSAGVGREASHPEEPKSSPSRSGPAGQAGAGGGSSSSSNAGRTPSPPGTGSQLAALCNTLGWRRLGGRDAGHGAVSVEDGGVR